MKYKIKTFNMHEYNNTSYIGHRLLKFNTGIGETCRQKISCKYNLNVNIISFINLEHAPIKYNDLLYTYKFICIHSHLSFHYKTIFS